MKLTKKLAAGFAVVIVLAVVIGVIGVRGMKRSHESGREMYENHVKGLEYIGKASAAFKQVRLECHRLVVNSFYDDLKGVQDIQKDFDSAVEEFEYWMARSYDIATTDELIRFHDRIMILFRNDYMPKTTEVNKTALEDIPDHGNRLYINTVISSNVYVGAQIENYLLGLMDLNSALSKQTSDNDMNATARFIRLQIVMIIAAIIVAIIVTLYIIRSIAVPINNATDALAQISQGSFEVRVECDQAGALGTLQTAVNETAEKLTLYLTDKLLAERSAHVSDIEKAKVEAASEAVFASIEYASKIQKGILPKDEEFEKAFSDYSTIWKPRDMVGGDIYWIKNYDEGTVLCVCDCTGHGTPGAILTMLVISSFESSVNETNYQDPAEIIWQLEQRIVSTFKVNSYLPTTEESLSQIKDGCDLAVMYIAKNGDVKISSGRTNVFICDGVEVKRIKGQKISVGEGTIEKKEDLETVFVPANPNNKFYVASDGLYDQLGGEHCRPFGYSTFKKVILENHDKPQVIISEKVWQAFESYRGDQERRDDFELVTFKP